MEETSSKSINKTSAPGPASSSFLDAKTDGDKEDGAIDILDAEVPCGNSYAAQQATQSNDEPDEGAGLDAEDDDDDDAEEDAAAYDGHEVLPVSTTESRCDGVEALRRS